ncbi:MAG TPA: type II toxin-antitoxin system VapC family toxin [Candidatus Acidoferrales bacterium]|nr:type II toxin-antitoxin system VapC family toxin [Candidatus Acidoferrales bacterium]
MKRAVLDASAVMAFFEDRHGADKVEELISLAVAGKRDLLMSVVNWGEVYYSVWRAKGQGAARQAAAEIAQLPLEIVPADFELTKLAATFRANHKLPYADCFAAALASANRAPVVTADADFKAVAADVQVLFL